MPPLPNPGQGVMAAAESADLCLALGTSLHGTAPDTVPSIILTKKSLGRLGLTGCYIAG